MILALAGAEKNIKSAVVNKIQTSSKNLSHRRTFLLCLSSAVLFTFSFPPFSVWLFAWFAFIPFLSALQTKNPGQGFQIGFVFGLLIQGGIFYWFFHLMHWFSWIALVGVIFLFLYLALYPAVFAWVFSLTRSQPPLKRLVFLPSVWILLEYVRGSVLTGFGWGFLGHTQYLHIPVIQMADMTGVYGISFLVMMSNVYFLQTRDKRTSVLEKWLQKYVFYGLLVLFLGYGFWTIYHFKAEPDARVAVIQGNISQELKWSDQAWPIIMERHKRLTREAAQWNPDLIIWPETALPGFFGDDPLIFQDVQALAREVDIPLLVGAVVRTRLNLYLNSALLLDQAGEARFRYDKIHLVPFGEFLPVRYWIPDAVERIIPVSDFSRGRVHRLFTLDTLPVFNALICFEDTAPYLSRAFARKGSHFFINMTNDGWFGDTSAPEMHLQTALFRAIENRRSLVRAANTGMSAFIDPLGRMTSRVQDAAGTSAYVEGFSLGPVYASDEETFYTRYGDIFVLFCFFYILWACLEEKAKFFFKDKKIFL